MYIEVIGVEMEALNNFRHRFLNYNQRIKNLVLRYGVRSVESAIDDKVHGHNYFVRKSSGGIVELDIVWAERPYLRTKSDETLFDNLLYLPGGPFHYLVAEQYRRNEYIPSSGFGPSSRFSGGIATNAHQVMAMQSTGGLLGRGGIVTNALQVGGLLGIFQPGS